MKALSRIAWDPKFSVGIEKIDEQPCFPEMQH